MFQPVLLAAVLGLVLAQSNAAAAAASAASVDPEAWLKFAVVQQGGNTLEEVDRRMPQLFDELADDGAIVNAQTFDRRAQISAASSRARFIGELLRKDIDGDSAISKSDLDVYYFKIARAPLNSTGGLQIQPTKEQIEQVQAQLEEKDFKYDADRDGKISFDEILAAAHKNESLHANAGGGRPPNQLGLDKIMSLDADKDGNVTRGEYMSAVHEAFSAIDANGDGTISTDEIEASFNR